MEKSCRMRNYGEERGMYADLSREEGGQMHLKRPATGGVKQAAALMVASPTYSHPRALIISIDLGIMIVMRPATWLT